MQILEAQQQQTSMNLAYSEHEETEMLAVFTYAIELGFEPGLNSPE